MATSNILQFAPTDTGTNLLTDAAYLAASDRNNGNQPGVASSKLNNKALRQASAIVAGVAQYMADRQATNVTDALTPAQISTMMGAAALGRILRTTIYTRVAGVQNVSVDGGANTTTGATTWTRLAETRLVRMQVQGGGSGGSASSSATAGTVSIGGPGCPGAYGESLFTAAAAGSSQTITAGLASAGGSGAAGGTSSVGALMTSPGGGAAGALLAQTPPTINGNGITSGSPTGFNVAFRVGRSLNPSLAINTTIGYGAAGGDSYFGQGGPAATMNTNGIAATAYGAGGGTSVVNQGGGSALGGDGGPGTVIITEYS